MRLNTTTLGEHLLATQQDGGDADLNAVLFALADAAADIARGGSVSAKINSAADFEQVCLDRSLLSLRQSPAALLVSDCLDTPRRLDGGAGLAVTLSPLAGTTASPGDLLAGNLFAVHALDAPVGAEGLAGPSLRAAGVVVFGMPTAMALALDDAVNLYQLDAASGEFRLAQTDLQVPREQRELAVDMSNYRLWDSRVRHYVDACIAGAAGPQGADYALHWHGSLAPELLRVLTRGGLYLAPDDARPGYDHGCQDFLCQALPAAYLVERAGGRAVDGYGPILERALAPHGTRVPLIFGSRDAVAQVLEYFAADPTETTRYPLFETRSLLRN